MIVLQGESMLKLGDKIGLVACSNPLDNSQKALIEKLCVKLKTLGLVPVKSKYIFVDDFSFYPNGKLRAKAFLDFYSRGDINAIFDVSGGDIANEVLEYLDFNLIKNSPKAFLGYSDLTTLINAIYNKTGNLSYLYQIKNLIKENSEIQIKNFKKTVLENEGNLYNIKYKFLQGSKMQGVVVGGNIRCLLKLAGTEFMPDFKGKILFLESFSGKEFQMTTYFSQLKQLGVFDCISGLLLGTFTEMEKDNDISKVEDMLVNIINKPNLPIAKTQDVGHNSNSKCLIIGKEYELKG